MRRYFEAYARELGLSWPAFMALGRESPGDQRAPFCMTTFALRLAAHRNGVSRLHGRVSRKMWQVLWPGLPEEEVPIGCVTNGVHFRSWISLETNRLYERYLGPRWREEPADQAVWQRAERIATEELWRTHERRRERLVAFVRRRLRNQRERQGAPQSAIEAADEVMDPEVLTIGFARRFATYKRATLLLRDPGRLAEILGNPDCPVQVIYAGKAHPMDEEGKRLIAEIVKMSHQEPFRRRLVFLEDYNMDVARYLVQGADVWLNTPRRPHEACGTSGMKAAANGGLNLSVLDGWWDQAYQPGIGWAIGRGETYEDEDYQDQVEANALYELLERDVVPAFYGRRANGVPQRWTEYVKGSMSSLCHYYNAHRMVREYTEHYYLPVVERCGRLTEGGAERAKALAAWKRRVREHWPQIRIRSVDGGRLADLHVGERARVQAGIDLGELGPDDVRVEFYLGRVAASGEVVQGKATAMDFVDRGEQGQYLYASSAVSCQGSGQYGYTVRVLPHHPDLLSPYMPGLITWAGSEVKIEEGMDS
jgi:starch phosphorylase